MAVSLAYVCPNPTIGISYLLAYPNRGLRATKDREICPFAFAHTILKNQSLKFNCYHHQYFNTDSIVNYSFVRKAIIRKEAQ